MSDHHQLTRIEPLDPCAPVCCPFCRHVVLREDAEETSVDPCPHTLFIATDEGFEFRSGRYDALKRITGVEDQAIPLDGHGWDGYTDQLCCPGAVKIALYTPAPSGLGCYVGFAP
jgi:hypothetical protein